jgi:hypothetical protein
MTSTTTTRDSASEAELLIHLDTAGLAALLRAVEAAMVQGRGHLVLSSGTGITAGGGSSERFASVTVTFAGASDPSGDRDLPGRPDLPPSPRTPVLELHG